MSIELTVRTRLTWLLARQPRSINRRFQHVPTSTAPWRSDDRMAGKDFVIRAARGHTRLGLDVERCVPHAAFRNSPDQRGGGGGGK